MGLALHTVESQTDTSSSDHHRDHPLDNLTNCRYLQCTRFLFSFENREIYLDDCGTQRMTHPTLRLRISEGSHQNPSLHALQASRVMRNQTSVPFAIPYNWILSGRGGFSCPMGSSYIRFFAGISLLALIVSRRASSKAGGNVAQSLPWKDLL